MKEIQWVGDVSKAWYGPSRDAWILTFSRVPTRNHFVIDEKLDVYLSKDVPDGYYQLLPGQNYLLINKYRCPLYIKPYDSKDYAYFKNTSWFVKTLTLLHQEYGIEYIECADRRQYQGINPGPKMERDLEKQATPEVISFTKLIYIIVNNTIEYGQFYRVEDIDDHCPQSEFLTESPLEIYEEAD